MAMFRIDIKPINARRSEGYSAAAYRAGERIRDERTGKVHNHSRRQDVTHTEILFCHPDSVSRRWSGRGTEPVSGMLRRPPRKLHNSRVAREFQVRSAIRIVCDTTLGARAFLRPGGSRTGMAQPWTWRFTIRRRTAIRVIFTPTC